MKTLALAAVLVCASVTLWARHQQASTFVEGLSPSCTYEFGSGNFKWCVSDSGNVMRLESPAGFEHIRVGSLFEGYAVCASGAGPYFDYGSVVPGPAPSGWGPATLTAGPTSTSVTISRTTTDGRFTLLQAFKGDKNERELVVSMTLTNNGAPASDVHVVRHVDFDVDANFDNFWDATPETVWAARNDGVFMNFKHAATIEALGLTPDHIAAITSFAGSGNCNPVIVSERYGDFGAFVHYKIGGLGAGKKTTVKFRYGVH